MESVNTHRIPTTSGVSLSPELTGETNPQTEAPAFLQTSHQRFDRRQRRRVSMVAEGAEVLGSCRYTVGEMESSDKKADHQISGTAQHSPAQHSTAQHSTALPTNPSHLHCSTTPAGAARPQLFLLDRLLSHCLPLLVLCL